MSSFPILRLPYLPVCNVFSNLNSEEIFDLSICSKKVQKIVKYWSRNRFRMNLVFDNENRITFYSKNDTRDRIFFCYEHISIPLNNPSLSTTYSNLRFFPFNIRSGTYFEENKLIDYLIDIFNCPIIELWLVYKYIKKSFRFLVQHFLSRQSTFPKISFGWDVINNEDLKYFFENCKTENLYINFRIEKEFEDDLNLNLYSILIEADWVRLKHLSRMNFTSGCFPFLSLTIEELLELLSAWMNGWNKRMKQFSFNSENFKWNQLETSMKSIQAQRIDDNIVRLFQAPTTHFNGISPIYRVDGGYDVRRHEDGVIATAVLNLKHSHRAEVFVWD